MVILEYVLELLGMLAGFGAFIWLAFAMLLIKVSSEAKVIEDEAGQRSFLQPTLQAWPKVMKLMFISGAGVSILICLPFMVSSPTFTVTNILIIFICMLLGFLYLRHFTAKAVANLDKASLRHCIVALFISSGYLAAIIIVAIVNPLFGGQSMFNFS